MDIDNITEKDVEELLSIRKILTEKKTYPFPKDGKKLNIPMTDDDGKKNFILDITSSSIVLKYTFQNRFQKTIKLARLDINGPPHTNPPNFGKSEISGNHIHIYKDGFELKYAEELDSSYHNILLKPFEIMKKFMAYCNIQDNDSIRYELGLFNDK